MRKDIAPWLPAVFCAILSFITLVEQFFVAFRSGNASNMPIAFLCFLPMCFFFVGASLSHLQKENRALKERLDEFSTEILSESGTSAQLEV